MRDDERQSEIRTSEFPSWLCVNVSFASEMHISLQELSRQKSGTLGEQEIFVISVWEKVKDKKQLQGLFGGAAGNCNWRSI